MMSERPNIRVRACVAIIQDGKILMTPHSLKDGSINWHMPGGGVYTGETLRQAAERELQEETGYIGKADELLKVYEVIRPQENYHGIGMIFSGEITGGELTPEVHPIYGVKTPEWLTREDLQGKVYDHAEFIHQLLDDAL